jgi:hypothetical protein
VRSIQADWLHYRIEGNARWAYALVMARKLTAFLIFISCVLADAAWAATKPHVITFGKWTTVPLFVGPEEKQKIEIKIRPLLIDARVKEFTLGEPHDVTDRLLVIRKAYRLNDWLPEYEGNKAHRWKWQRGGWLVIDRSTGKVSPLSLPLFDPFYSEAAWFRDFAAYCGISDNGERVFAIVSQLGQKRPLVRQELGKAKNGETPDSECATPDWQREPTRVTFQPSGGQRVVFTIHAHATEMATKDDTDADNDAK